jgi:proteasome accessory factor A
MSARRVMGIETEYGVSAPGDPTANAMLMSSQVVNAYAAPLGHRAGRARWDYEDEAPLRDARGWEIGRGDADPSQLTDAADDPGLANVILSNGARLYVDHAHPEYSSPEVTNPRDAVLWDKAGEQVMLQAARRIAAAPGLGPVNLYKNNTDNKGASYGTHENYLMRRETPFAEIVRHLTPFFVSRQVVTGAGRVGRGQDGTGVGFQISQRADFFEVEVGLETTLKRPIINTRDEPHASADRFRRLHVIIGDANLCEVATYLKVGTTALVLELIEERGFTRDLSVERPVAGLHAVSHDPSLSVLLKLRDGRTATAVQLQWLYLEQVTAYVQDRYGSDVEPDTADVLQRWESVLSRLENDPHVAVPRARLGGQAAAARGVPPARGAVLGRRPAAADRPAVGRRPAREGALPPPRRPRPGRADRHRRGGPARGRGPPGRHPRVLPRPLPVPVRRARGRRLLGLGDLRCPGPGRAAAGADPGPAPRHQGARRCLLDRCRTAADLVDELAAR